MDDILLRIQREEINQHYIYKLIAKRAKTIREKRILIKLSNQELVHYNFWKSLTKQEIKPNKFKILKYSLITKLFGLTFGIRSLENEEKSIIKDYGHLVKKYPTSKKIIYDSEKHEEELISLIKEERLNYLSSMVLGINDALVELTGALAGFTFALKNPKLIAIIGLITGIAASLSMAASEYLSIKSDPSLKKAKTAAVYTGVAYIFTVLVLILPYLIFNNIYLSLTNMIINAIIIIFFFTYYLSVAKNLSFKKKFLEMAIISLSIALISFFIGFIINYFFSIPI
ncbi:VIT1/CCC1 transporter family protein [Candidatus Woesearchaeota archaeon]|nr:VIT1/CCC1 transporter family protein [Candidatus Woesearchaeota archaeon]